MGFSLSALKMRMMRKISPYRHFPGPLIKFTAMTMPMSLKPGYLANFGNESAATITMEKIMTEKYKAIVAINGEAWVDVRRHNYQYPDYLEIPITKDNIQVASQFIQRVLYPQESLNTNPNTPNNVSIFDKLWIFQ